MNSVEIGSLIIIGLSTLLILWGQFSDDQCVYSGYSNSTVSSMYTTTGLIPCTSTLVQLLGLSFCVYSVYIGISTVQTMLDSKDCGGGDEKENKLGNGNTLCASSVSNMVPLVVPLVCVYSTLGMV